MQRQSLFPLKSLLFLFHATNTIVISFLPLYLQYKGLNGTEIGWVLAIGPFASIISQPFWGYLSDKYNTVKRMLLISVIGMLIASVIFFQMNHLLAILCIGAIFYFFSSPVGALSDSLAQRRADELGISFGSIRTWGSIGFAFSSLVVGQILTTIGIGNMVWAYLFFGSILLIVVFLIEDVPAKDHSVSGRDVISLLKQAPYTLFLLSMVFITITHRANDSFIGLYIADLGGSESLVGIAWFIGLISEATIFALAVFWFRKFNPIFFLIIASLLYALRWLLFGISDSPYTIIALQLLHGLTFGVFYVASFEFVSKLVPGKLIATGHLIFYSVFFGVSGIIGSLVGGKVIDLYSIITLYKMMTLLAMVGIALFIAYYVWLQRKTNKTAQNHHEQAGT